MTKLMNSITKLGTISIVLIMAIAFISCGSTQVEETETVEAPQFEELQEGKSPYYDQFFEKFQNNPNDESIEQIFDSWKVASPDGDYYKSCFVYYYNQAATLSDNSNVPIPDTEAYIEDSEDKNILIYRNMTVNKNKLDKAISYLKEGIKKYPNRIDLWDVLNKINMQSYFYYDLKNSILDFIDIIYIMDRSPCNWYADFNQVIETAPFSEQGSIVRNMLFTFASFIVDTNSGDEGYEYYKEIFSFLAELYPEDSEVLGELGFAYMFTNDVPGAIPYLEKAYELNNRNGSALLNLTISHILMNNEEKAVYYTEKIYDSGDENLIQLFEQSLAGFLGI